MTREIKKVQIKMTRDCGCYYPHDNCLDTNCRCEYHNPKTNKKDWYRVEIITNDPDGVDTRMCDLIDSTTITKLNPMHTQTNKRCINCGADWGDVLSFCKGCRNDPESIASFNEPMQTQTIDWEEDENYRLALREFSSTDDDSLLKSFIKDLLNKEVERERNKKCKHERRSHCGNMDRKKDYWKCIDCGKRFINDSMQTQTIENCKCICHNDYFRCKHCFGYTKQDIISQERARLIKEVEKMLNDDKYYGEDSELLVGAFERDVLKLLGEN